MCRILQKKKERKAKKTFVWLIQFGIKKNKKNTIFSSNLLILLDLYDFFGECVRERERNVSIKKRRNGENGGTGSGGGRKICSPTFDSIFNLYIASIRWQKINRQLSTQTQRSGLFTTLIPMRFCIWQLKCRLAFSTDPLHPHRERRKPFNLRAKSSRNGATK